MQGLTPRLAGKFFYYCLPYRRRVVLDNINRVFGDTLSQPEKINLAQCFYAHLWQSILENIKMRFMTPEQIKSQSRVKNPEYVLQAAEQNQGVLILTGHLGNWEFAPIAGMMNFTQYQGRWYFVRKTLKWKWLETLLFKRYHQAGLNVIPKQNSLNQVMDQLEKNNVVVFVMDQHASLQAKDSVLVNFFGHPAGTYRSLATIANYTNTPVIPASCYREPDGQHVLEFHPPLNKIIHEDRREAIKQNTQHYNNILEQLILTHPEQWLWVHKRWKTT